MKENENKIKHLEFLQLVITRMNVNSFLIKGWIVTIIAAVFVLATKDTDRGFILFALFPTLIFWFLDGYYLYQERLFRLLYNIVKDKNEENIDYNMDTTIVKKNGQYFNVLLSISLSLFYLSLIAVILISMFCLTNLKGT